VGLALAHMSGHVFISYSSGDKVVADRICASLEGAGHRCWIAPRDIEPGADYPAAIIQGLQLARAVVVVVSAASVASPNVLSEIGHAFGEKKTIIPFRLSNVVLPSNFDYFLSLSQWLDAHDGCTSQNLARLTEAVSEAMSGATTILTEGRTGLNRRMLFAAVVLVIAVAVVVYWRWPSAKIEVKLPSRRTDTGLPPPVVEGKATRPRMNPKDGSTYVWIPPGSFTMGCSPGDTECNPDELPAHLVEIPRGFWLGQTEVTRATYSRVRKSTSPSQMEARLPVVGTSWRQANAYCAATSGRLPTEAEWEYAARGGVSGPYYGTPSEIAWYAGNSGGILHEVATRQPDSYGLYDMLGNASEWVADRYFQSYDPDAPAIGNVQQPLAPNAFALTRGGYWQSELPNIRVSRRAEMENDDSVPMAGIRCVME